MWPCSILISATSALVGDSCTYPDPNTNSVPLALLNPLSSDSQYKVDPQLPAKKSLTFGYGYGGDAPLVFSLAKGRDMEVGFLKLFVCTKYVDLSDVEQLPPSMVARGISRADVKPLVTWDTIEVTVVLRKRKEAVDDEEPEISKTRMKQAENHGHLRRPPPGAED